MKTVLTGLFATVVFALSVSAQGVSINIIPKPEQLEIGTGHFTLNRDTRIVARRRKDKDLARKLNEYLSAKFGISLKIVSSAAASNYILVSDGADHVRRIKDGYGLRVEPGSITIEAALASGRFYALQTLIQLMPTVGSDQIKIPVVKVNDFARFPYRGMHLDVARHFMPVEFVKKYIDLMSQYKFNYFHWHLTEDQGWRIEIKKYPRLTEIGSKRPETVKERNLTPYIGDGIPHGGFYTQEQIKNVVAYAKARHIIVIPEIELPGHASAALAAYPQLGCKPDYQYKVQTTWGIFKEVFCPTDETFKFLEDVLDETIKLFPDSPYIHIGGDEVLKDHWKESAFVQELKKRENLKDEHEVQSYFIRRIEKYINSKGKKMIGWDEILEGGLAPNATVMSWRGIKGGIEAAKSKHDVIMTPTDYVYFDYGQGDPTYEPLSIGSYVPLEKVYSFEPVPKELTADEAKYVIGGQANIWTEYMKTPAHVEYMAFPRMLALAEVLWSPAEGRGYSDFYRRMLAHLPRLDAQGVSYRIPEPMPVGGFLLGEKEAISFEIKSPVAGGTVRFTIDGSTPTESSPEAPTKFVANPAGNEGTLKTIVILPNGRMSSVYAATFLRGTLREPVERADAKQGVNYELLIPRGGMGEGERKTGETRSIQLNQFSNQGVDIKKPFSVTYDGYFRAPADGVYELQVDSTWDTTVVLGGAMVIDDAGTKDRKVRSTLVPLKAGLHRISIRYNHRGGDASFRFRWGIKGEGLRQAYGGEFVY